MLFTNQATCHCYPLPLGFNLTNDCTKKNDTYLVTSDAFEPGHTQTQACFGVAFSAVLQVTVTWTVTIHPKPSTGALTITTVAIETRYTVALASETITACTIPASARGRAVHTKRALVARLFAASTLVSCRARAGAWHVITDSTILARAFVNAVTTVPSFRANALTKDACVSLQARAGSISYFTRLSMWLDTLACVTAVHTVAIWRAT